MMSDGTTDQMRGRRQNLSLGRLFLDPNNFRFFDHPEYRPIAPENVFDAHVQRRTTGFVLGRHQEHVRDLIASMKANGWLDIDPILVERRDKGRFVVVEGNRRLGTLKYLQSRYQEDAIDLGNLDPTIFSALPVVLYQEADERDRLVMMGLHHISGKRRWPAINRARAMEQLLQHFHNDADAVCQALGVSKREFNLSVRTLALVDTYKESDYGDQLQSDQYSLFREILKSESMRAWLGWDHTALAASSQPNLNLLFSWMSREGESDEGDEEGQEVDITSTSDPVITTVGHVRELSKIISDPQAVKKLDETRSLQEATLSSDLLVRNDVDDAFKSCDRGIQKLDRRIADLASSELDRVDQLIGRLQGIMLARKRQPPTAGHRFPWQPFNEITQSQFASIRVDRYRGISGLRLTDLGRVNLIVGLNNAGKTSVLEAISLLTHQNDERALLDTICRRSRVERDPPPLWLVEQLPRNVRISGHFDQVPDSAASVEFEVDTQPESDIEDQTSFLSKLNIESTYGQHAQSTEVVFFEDRARRVQFQGQNWLCRSAITSPFSADHLDSLARANKESLERGTKRDIIEFIRGRVDPGVQNIELADQFNRFLVGHDGFTRAPDLGTFGDGMRRVFEIGLLCAGVRGGVLLIDEFENAIHTELLVEFTRLVRDLSVDLNVQVFLSTHSKEAIDAFVLNEHNDVNVVGYAISRTANSISARRYDGNKLKDLHEAVDFDLRGVR